MAKRTALRLQCDAGILIALDLCLGAQWTTQQCFPIPMNLAKNDKFLPKNSCSFMTLLGDIQPPMECEMPPVGGCQRQKKKGTPQVQILENNAGTACLHAKDKDACVFNVLASNDLDHAGVH